MRASLLFLALSFAIAAVGVGILSSARRDLWPTAGDLRSEGDLRPVKPTHDSPTPFRLGYDDVLNGRKPLTADERSAIRTTTELPRTACKSVEVVHGEAARRAHELTIDLFTTESGFGFVRMFAFTNSRGIATGAKEIDRVELVSL